MNRAGSADVSPACIERPKVPGPDA